MYSRIGIFFLIFLCYILYSSRYTWRIVVTTIFIIIFKIEDEHDRRT